jgi:hypothetical protein
MSRFTPQDADTNHARLRGDEGVIPQGMYCYSRASNVVDPENGIFRDVVPCPYWGHDPEKGEQQDGYCAHLKAGDWEDEGTMLLWDMVKECGVNDDLGEDEAA